MGRPTASISSLRPHGTSLGSAPYHVFGRHLAVQRSFTGRLNMQLLPIRLLPGTDLRRALQDGASSRGTDSAFVVAGIGSLIEASLRYADEPAVTVLPGPLEIQSLSGSLSALGAHLHMTVADASGRVYGGHLGYGSTIRTTAEILLALLPNGSLTREHDPETGFDELVVRGGSQGCLAEGGAIRS